MRQIDAKDGETYEIGISDHGLGALHPVGVPVEKCVVCAKMGQTLTLANIPVDLQKEFDIGERETVSFIETAGSDIHIIHDYLDFENGSFVPFHRFADCGVTAYVGIPLTQSAMDDLQVSIASPKTLAGVTTIGHEAGELVAA